MVKATGQTMDGSALDMGRKYVYAGPGGEPRYEEDEIMEIQRGASPILSDASEQMAGEYDKSLMSIATPQDAQGEWEERFDKQKFCYDGWVGDDKDKRLLHTNYDTTQEVKQFIRQELSTQLERLGERVRKEVIGEDFLPLLKKTEKLMHPKAVYQYSLDLITANMDKKRARQSLDLLIQEEKKKV